MSVKTNNIYGKISVSERTIEKFIAHVAMDCYGIVEFSPENFKERLKSYLFGSLITKGVKVHSVGDRMFVDVAIVVKYGVSIKAVVDSLKESVKYKVERFTGMIVDTINVKVTGVKK